MLKENINEFGKFIEENKGHLAAIGIFAALTKYFPPSSSSDTIFLSGFTFILFIFLSTTLFIKTLLYSNEKENYILSTFCMLFLFFSISIVGYFSVFFTNWMKLIKIIVSFFIILYFMGKIYDKLLKQRNICTNIISIVVGAIILHLSLNFIKKFPINDEYLSLGIISPFLFSIIFLFILLPSIIVLQKIFNCLKKVITKTKEFVRNRFKS